MAKLFKVGIENPTPITLNPSNGKTFTLEELQEAVGGYVEFVPCAELGVVIVCDEEGWIKSKPVNEKASFVAMQMLAGDVLFCDQNEIE